MYTYIETLIDTPIDTLPCSSNLFVAQDYTVLLAYFSECREKAVKIYGKVHTYSENFRTEFQFHSSNNTGLFSE